MPDEDGLDIARKLEGVSGLGIVMLTARGEMQDRIRGLDSGADAYLTKPVDINELLAVIQSIYRRIKTEANAADAPVTKNENEQKLCLDASKRCVYLPQGGVLELTAKEGTLLYVLAQSAPAPVSRRALTESLGVDFLHYDERRLEAAMSRLRKKLTDVCLNDEVVLIAARGKGYQLVIDIQVS